MIGEIIGAAWLMVSAACFVRGFWKGDINYIMSGGVLLLILTYIAAMVVYS